MGQLSTESAARMCPVCGEDSYVYESRERPDGSILRRRRCRACGQKFVTLEVLAYKIFPTPPDIAQGGKKKGVK